MHKENSKIKDIDMPKKKIDTSKKIESSKTEVKYKNIKTNDGKDVNISEPKLADKNVRSPISFPDTRELFARKKDYGVVTMTEQASTRADETAKDRQPTNKYNIPPRLGNCIHKIRED